MRDCCHRLLDGYESLHVRGGRVNLRTGNQMFTIHRRRSEEFPELLDVEYDGDSVRQGTADAPDAHRERPPSVEQ